MAAAPSSQTHRRGQHTFTARTGRPLGRACAVRQRFWRAARNGFAERLRGESGMSTAEYAVGTLGAVAFAGVLVLVANSGFFQDLIESLITQALS
ncbi:DUF4244 domain-containing protein [Natronoglycomyces albus]|uniref:DUF4244 domain-containing protein n=1 Tax=Natronoglycomyces albus TaxID=2811108 RepID=A0A895XTB6_9ACTN|nr:DUF4244 domain-containing protein [Natronoglycomyces albus]QSB06892.1 DUF4244 domain-containing protein [Natronoglycomyces albus]